MAPVRIAVERLDQRIAPANVTFNTGLLAIDLSNSNEAVTVANSSSGVALSGSTFTGAGAGSFAGVNRIVVTDSSNLGGQSLSFTGTPFVLNSGMSASGVENVTFSQSIDTSGGSAAINVTAPGSIAVNSTLQGSAGGVSLTAQNRLTVGGSIVTSAGAVSLTAADADIQGPITSGSVVTIAAPQISRPINLGTNAVGSLSLTDSELDRISVPTLNLGSANSGPLTVSADISRPASTAIQLASGGAIALIGGSFNTGGGALTLAPGLAGVLSSAPGFDAVVGNAAASGLNFAPGADLVVLIDGTVADSQYTPLNVAGAVNLANVDLVLSGSYTPAAGNTFPIVSATSVTGEFNGLRNSQVIAFNGVQLIVEYSATAVTLWPNSSPVITSNGGGATAAITIAENTASVTRVTASDADDAGQILAYSIVGGADAAYFNISPAYGVLGFNVAPKFEGPLDAGADNIYDVVVQVSDGTAAVTQSLRVTVADVNEAPGLQIVSPANPTVFVSGTGNSVSYSPVLSADGRYAVFVSSASNLVSGDSNGVDDIFRKDLQTGTIVRVSTNASGNQANIGSSPPAVSADGRYVVFRSDASNLVSGDTNGKADVFWKDLQTGTIVRVSTDFAGNQANNYSDYPTVSADGRFVIFTSYASNLVSGDTAGTNDIFCKDMQTGAIVRVSAGFNGTQISDEVYEPVVSTDGRYVVFCSYSTNLVSGDTNDRVDIFRKDLQTGTVVRVSTDSSGNQANNVSDQPALSTDGRYVVFLCYASNLVSGDTNGAPDIFRKDLQTGALVRVTTDASGNQTNSYSDYPALSADGRYVVFRSNASNLVSGDTNGTLDVFRKDLQTGTIVRVSTDSSGNQANSPSDEPVVSPDGRYVVFRSFESSFATGDTNATWDLFRKDLQTGKIIAESTAVSSGSQTANGPSNSGSQMTGDGRFVVFASSASNLVNGDTNGAVDIFRTDLQTGAVVRVSTDSSGNQVSGVSDQPAVSADGRYVVFRSTASTLVDGDTNGVADIFCKDLQTGTVVRVSTDSAGNQANGASDVPAVSADGRYVVFNSLADNLVSGESNNRSDIFRKDLQTGMVVRVSTDSSGAETSGICDKPAVSADGRYVVFRSLAYNLVAGDTNNAFDVFRKDLQTGTVVRLSTDASGNQANGISDRPAPSADGRYVVFSNTASNLVSGDTNGASDVFRKDLQTGTIVRVSTDSNGNQANGVSDVPTVSADGRYVVFRSSATNLVSGDTNGTTDLFRKDMLTGVIIRITAAGSGLQADNGSYAASISSNGRKVAFPSDASNLGGGDLNGSADIFLWDQNGLLTVSPDSIPENSGANAVVGTLSSADPDAGDTITYTLVAGDGSVDNAAFHIVGNQLLANSSFDFETRQYYLVRVRATDQGGLYAEATFPLTVNDANDPAIITNDGGGAAAPRSIPENSVDVTVVTATDSDRPVQTLSFSIVGGADAALFTIDGVTGALRFVAAPNFEQPTDAGGDNVYNVIVQVSDGLAFTAQSIAVTITNVEEPPIITSNGGASASISIAENTAAVTQVIGTDQDASSTLTYSLSGPDAAFFSINSATGFVRFLAAPDYESPRDVDANNLYQIAVQVSDSVLFDTQALSIAVTDVAQNSAPVYIDDDWAVLLTGATIADADPYLAGNQPAIFGQNSFSDVGGIEASNAGATVTLLPGAYVQNASLGAGIALQVPAGIAAVAGILSGSSGAGLRKTGNGTLALNGTNNFVGAVDIRRGKVQVSSDAGLGAEGNGVIVNAPGELIIAGDTTSSRSFDLNDGALTIATNTTLTLVGAEALGGFIKGPGRIATSSALSTAFNGVTFQSSLVVTVYGADSLTNVSSAAALTIAPGSTTALAGFSLETGGTLSIAGLANAADFRSYGQMTVTGTLANVGTSRLALGGGSVTAIDAGGSIDVGSYVALVSGGLVTNYGNFGSATNGVVVDFGGKVQGPGVFHSVVTQNGGIYSPGNSPGGASLSSFPINGGGKFDFEIANTAGSAGTRDGWDMATVAPNVFNPASADILLAATVASPYTILLSSRLANGTTAGPAANFNPAYNYAWKFLDGSSANTAVSGSFDPAAFNVDTSGFANPIAGTFGIELRDDGKNLYVVYTPPSVATTTSLTATPNATTGGTLVTFTATVAPNPGSLGTVSFLDNNQTIAENVAAAEGMATFQIATLSAGSHPIKAAYRGAVGFAASVSSVMNFSVTAAATTTTLTAASPNPVLTTQPIALTIAVAGGGATDGESVAIVDASNGDAVVPTTGGVLSGGVATLTIEAGRLSAGTHNLVAVYAGNGYNNSSQSAAAPLVVAAAPQVMSVVPNGNLPGLAGDQRSRVVSLQVAFNEPVQLDASAITLALHADGVVYHGVAGPVGVVPANLVVSSADNTTWIVTFDGGTDPLPGTYPAPSDGLQSIQDGVYDLNVDASKVHPLGVPSIAAAANSTTVFYRLFGDVTGEEPTAGNVHSATINTADNLNFRNAFNSVAASPDTQYKPYFDFDGDGQVNTTDNFQFRGRFNNPLTWTV